MQLVAAIPFKGSHYLREEMSKKCFCFRMQMQSRTRSRPPTQTVTEIEPHRSLNDSVGGMDLKEGSCPRGSVPFLKATKSGPLDHSAIANFARSREMFFRLKSNSTELPTGYSDDDDDRKNRPVQREVWEALPAQFPPCIPLENFSCADFGFCSVTFRSEMEYNSGKIYLKQFVLFTCTFEHRSTR